MQWKASNFSMHISSAINHTATDVIAVHGNNRFCFLPLKILYYYIIVDYDPTDDIKTIVIPLSDRNVRL